MSLKKPVLHELLTKQWQKWMIHIMVLGGDANLAYVLQTLHVPLSLEFLVPNVLPRWMQHRIIELSINMLWTYILLVHLEFHNILRLDGCPSSFVHNCFKWHLIWNHWNLPVVLLAWSYTSARIIQVVPVGRIPLK